MDLTDLTDSARALSDALADLRKALTDAGLYAGAGDDPAQLVRLAATALRTQHAAARPKRDEEPQLVGHEALMSLATAAARGSIDVSAARRAKKHAKRFSVKKPSATPGQTLDDETRAMVRDALGPIGHQSQNVTGFHSPVIPPAVSRDLVRKAREPKTRKPGDLAQLAKEAAADLSRC